MKKEKFNLLISNALYILTLSKNYYKINYKYNESININHYIVKNFYIAQKEIEFNDSIIIFKEITFDFEIEIINNNPKRTINVKIKFCNDYNNISFLTKNEFHLSSFLNFKSKYNEDFFQVIIKDYSKQLNSIIEEYNF